MKSIFEALWNGNIAPYKTCGSGDPEVEELDKLIERNKASLDNALTNGQKELLENYISCQDEYSYLITVHAFRDGFSLACRLLTEALVETQ